MSNNKTAPGSTLCPQTPKCGEGISCQGQWQGQQITRGALGSKQGSVSLPLASPSTRGLCPFPLVISCTQRCTLQRGAPLRLHACAFTAGSSPPSRSCCSLPRASATDGISGWRKCRAWESRKPLSKVPGVLRHWRRAEREGDPPRAPPHRSWSPPWSPCQHAQSIVDL